MNEMRYSIIIPTLNRASILKKCLEYLQNIESPKYGWEILVVDNGSTDETK